MERNFNVDRRFQIFCDKLTSNNVSNDLIIESSYNTIELSSNTIIFDGHVDLSMVTCNNINISNISEIVTKFLRVKTLTLPSNVRISYNSVNDGYITNTRVGYNSEGIGRSDAYFTYINVSGGDSSFNNSLYINKNLVVDGTLTISNNLLINGANFASVETSFNNYKAALEQNFYSTKITTKDVSALNISLSNELVVNKTAYINNITISGQLLNSVLKVPHLFTIDPSGYNNASGALIINGDLIVRGTETTLASSYVDICDVAIKLASNLVNILDLYNTNAGLDISNIASLKYNGTTWDFSGGQLTVDNKKVLFSHDVSLAKRNFDLSINALITDFSSSFFTIKRNIDDSYNDTYSRSQIDNSFILRSNVDVSLTSLLSYITNSYVSKNQLDASFNVIKALMDLSYVAKNSVLLNTFDTSFASFNTKLDISYALKSAFEASHNSLKTDFDISFASFNTSIITIETINTPINKTLVFIPSSSSNINTTISGDLIVTGKANLKSLNISNRHIFDVSGYSSNYLATTDIGASIVDYYSNVGYTYNRVFKIDACGNITNYSGFYGPIVSDSRLKENIVNCTPKLEKLLKVRVVNYNLKGPDKTKYIGVVAQELEELFPELVLETNSVDKFKSVSYSNLTILLIKAFQEQQVLINNLITTLEELEK